MNINEVAKQSGVNAKMIRRYEELNILPKAKRSMNGYRTYSDNDIHNIRFVKSARELGFSMKDIKELLGLWKNKTRKSESVKKIALKHIEELEQKRKEIDRMLKTLRHLSHNCHGDQRPDCPIIEGLTHEN